MHEITLHSYGHLPAISTYNPIYRMYNPIYEMENKGHVPVTTNQIPSGYVKIAIENGH